MEKYFGNAYGSGPPPSPPLPGLTLTSGLSPTNSTGMTRQCFLNNITGRKRVPRINHINSSGIKWTKKCETRTTSTGLSTSHSLLQYHMLFFFAGGYYLREVGIIFPSLLKNTTVVRIIVLLNSLFNGSINFMLHPIFSH